MIDRKAVKTMLLQAVMWYFGMSQSEATNYIKLVESAGDNATLDEILSAYKNTAKMSFYND